VIGQTLGHYRIEARLGAGGMGVVYRARDERLGRTVALKVLPADKQTDEAARARLLREARAASALNHPHICTIYEVSDVGGQTYIAMELVEGQPLNTRVPAEGLPVEAVLRYGAQMADALAHAHERNIIHRDLKTANVVITPEGRAKVLDFGLAKQMTEELEGATRSQAPLTQEGGVSGTLHYMAPEALRGEATGVRSDIWALGVVLYEMASGQLPFEGKTGYQLSSAILHEPLRALSARVPAGLRAIIQRCLAKEPGERYRSASEVRAALEALQSDTAAVPAAARAERRVPLWAIVGGAVLILAVILGSFLKDDLGSLVGSRQGKEALSRSGPRLSTGGKPSRNAEANEYFEKAMLFLFAQYELPRARQMLERALELDPHFAEARAWYGFTHVLKVDGGSSNDTGWIYKAEEEERRALQDDPNCARAHSALAAIYIYQGHKELVLQEAEKALALNPDDLDALNWLQNYHDLNGDHATSEALARQMLERSPTFFPARVNLGEIRRERGDAAGAIHEQEKVLEQDPQNFWALACLARAYMEAGDLRQARRSLERVSSVLRSNFVVRLAWAVLLAREGKRAEARKEMDEEVLKYGAANPNLTAMVAEFYASLGEKGKAMVWLDRAVRNGDERAEWFHRDPALENIRDEPRFKQILESIAFRRQQREPAGR
jgi:serine/threonine-protein kinase